jgi:ribose transport system substrate-binding protein
VKPPMMLRRLLLVLLAVALLAVVISACGSSGGSSSEGEESTTSSESSGAAEEESGAEEESESVATVEYNGPEEGLPTEYPEPETTGSADCTIGYQNIFNAIASLAAQQEAAEEEAKNLGCKFIGLDDQLTPTMQVNHFSQLLSQGVSSIIVYPIVPPALKPSLSQASAKGVPVIADNTPPAVTEPLPEGYATRVLQGYDRAAYLRAMYIAENVEPGSEFAIMGLAIPVSSLQYFAKRTQYWAEKFGLKFAGQIDAQEDNPASASTAMSGIIAKYPNVAAVFAYNDNAAVAASTVSAASQKSVEICGGNGQKEAFQAIEKGAMGCTVLMNFTEIGRQLVRGAYLTITEQGGELPETVIPEPQLVDAESAGSLEPIG